MAQPPHVTHTLSSCRTQLQQNSSLTVTTVAPSHAPIPISGHLAARLCSVSPPQDGQVVKYALGTLEYRKEKNRKRTRTGEFVWNDEADLVFTLALLNWTSNRTQRLGTRRANFLQQFLARNGFLKTRKQIASRLQVLKGEWKATSYLNLLEDPERPKHVILVLPSMSPPVESEQGSASTPTDYASSTSSPTSSQSSHFGSEHGASVDATPHEKNNPAAQLLPSPPIDQDDKSALRRLVQDYSQVRGRELEFDYYAAPEAPLQIVTPHVTLHAPTAVFPGYTSPHSLPHPLPRPANRAPDFFPSHSPRHYPYTSCVQCDSCEPQNNALGGLFYQSRPYAY